MAFCSRKVSPIENCKFLMPLSLPRNEHKDNGILQPESLADWKLQLLDRVRRCAVGIRRRASCRQDLGKFWARSWQGLGDPAFKKTEDDRKSAQNRWQYHFVQVTKIVGKVTFWSTLEKHHVFCLPPIVVKDFEGPFRVCPGRGFQRGKVVFG